MCFASASICIHAQSQDAIPDKVERHLDRNHFADAAKILERKVKRNPESANLNEHLAFAYYKLHQFEDAEVYFEKADLMGGLSDQGLIQYGQVLFKNGKTVEAERVTKRYVKNQPNSFIAQLMLRSISRVAEWKNESASYKVKTVNNLNGRHSEFSPIPYQSGLVFATARHIDHINETSSEYGNTPYLAVYFAEIEDQEATNSTQQPSFKRPSIFVRNLIGDYNVGPVAIDTLRNQIFYTVSDSKLGSDGVSHLQLYVADLIKDKRIRNDRLFIKSDSFSAAHPSLSPDGKTLVFASDMNGTTGEMDLFVMTRTDSVSWSKPRSLSAKINTPLNEVFPYLKDDTTLFFASDGHAGFGGLDIFKSVKVEGRWTDPVNLKSPLNSNRDDFGICFTNPTAGYFSSSRDGGEGKDDIYAFVELADESDSSRVEVAGVFDYEDLPSEGVQLALIDENDNVLETVYTDSNGNFVFSQLPVGEEYTIKLIDATDDMLLKAEVFIVNEQGEAVLALDKNEQYGFKYRTLPKEEIAGLSPLKEVDAGGPGTYDLFGQLISKLDADVSEVKLIAENDNGRIIASAISDSNGFYQFYGLPKSEYLTIQPSTKDSVVYRSSVFYADEEMTQQLSSEGNEYFTYKFEIAKPTDTLLTPIRYTGFLKYDELPVEGIPVVVFDSNHKVIEVVRTNARGGFDLHKTIPKARYQIVLPDSFLNRTVQPTVYLVDKSSNRIVNTNALNFSTYIFTTLPSIDETLSKDDLAFVNKPYDLKGQVFKKLPGDYSKGMRILVYDEDGNLVETSIADSNGNFIFSKLRPDLAYRFEPQIEDEGLFQVVLFDEEGTASKYLRFGQLQRYAYNALQEEQVKRLGLLEEEDTPMQPLDDFIAGQIYYELPGDYSEGIMVYAFDEDGNVIDSTLTDGKGNFKFERLSSSDDFSIKVMDEVEKGELKVAIFDFEGRFLGLLFMNKENAFQYSKIGMESGTDLETMSGSDNSKGLMYGQVYRELPGDYDKSLKIYAFDADGNLMDVAQLDEDGNFRFTKLNQQEDYVFRITEDDTEFNIALMDKSGNILDRLHVFNGQWTYDKLAYENYELRLIEERDAAETGEDLTYKNSNKIDSAAKTIATLPFDIEGEAYYFDHRSDQLTADQQARLDAFVQVWKQNPDQILHISSHTASNEKVGEISYSAKRSVAVARYLHNNGVPTDNMLVSNWENEKPAIKCLPANPCSEQDRQKNRRSEVSLQPPSTLSEKPDYTVNYDFNKWKLDKDGERVMYRVLQELESNPDANVRIDGFTDTWGSYPANERISELRSVNVQNLLLLKGYSSKQLETIYHGETMPTGPCILSYPCPLELRETNRRVELRID